MILVNDNKNKLYKSYFNLDFKYLYIKKGNKVLGKIEDSPETKIITGENLEKKLFGTYF